MTKKRGLGTGRGLDALLGSIKQTQTEVAQLQATEQVSVSSLVTDLAVDSLQRGVYQPRREIDSAALNDLAESIKRHGVMQPIVVRPIKPANGVRYEIVAGERRWRAAKQVGLTHVPGIIREISDETAVALALIENIQREDLNAMEQAYALQRFHEEFGLSHQEIAETVGKARATVSNLLRLISLNDEVKLMLERGDIDMGHARSLLSLPSYEQTVVARQIVAKGLTVRQAEQMVRDHSAKTEQKTKEVNTDVQALASKVAERLSAQVQINHTSKGKGKLVISYHSLDELDGILAHFGVKP